MPESQAYVAEDVKDGCSAFCPWLAALSRDLVAAQRQVSDVALNDTASPLGEILAVVATKLFEIAEKVSGGSRVCQ